MKILFDLSATQPNGANKRHGGGIYGEIILKRMAARGIRLLCYYDSKRWLNPEMMELCESNDYPLFDINEKNLKEIVRDEKIDRLYTCLATNILTELPCTIYGTLHGLRHLETPLDPIFRMYKNPFKRPFRMFLYRLFPNLYYKRVYEVTKKSIFKENQKLVVVSNHTRYSLISFFPEMAQKEIPVFYSPDTSSKLLIERDCKDKYFLLVSGNRWEKNNIRAMIAFDRLISKGLISNMKMKVAGANGTEFRYKFSNRECFDFLGYVDDNELARLYANAYLFVYPSLNEGFGYPPLEAMNYSTPVISSCISSLAEVLAGGVLFFSPFSVDEIMNRMLMMMNTDIHEKYSKEGHEQFLKIQRKQKEDLDGLIDYIIK